MENHARSRPPRLFLDNPDFPVPPEAVEALRRLGKLHAQIDDGEGEPPPRRWAEYLWRVAMAEGYRGDPMGLHTLLAWRLRDEAWFWTVERMRCEWAIRDAVEALAERGAEPEALLREAARVNEAKDFPLFASEVVEAALDAVRRHLQFGGRRRA